MAEEETNTVYYYGDEAGGLAGEVKSEETKEAGQIITGTEYSYSYDERGNKKETAAETCGGVTTVTETVTDVMGRETKVTVRNAKAGEELQTDSVTENTYDGFGRLISSRITQGNTVTETSSSYDRNGTVLTEMDSDGVVTTYEYDRANRVISRNVK